MHPLRFRILLFFLIICSRLPAQSTIGNVINTYTPVLSLNSCNNKITVEDGSTFNAGDTVLIIQMKGAVIDSTNTSSFGTVTNYNNAGNYEINYVKSKAGNIIELKNKLTRSYDLPSGKVQLVRVPYYQDATVTSTLTCLPWDGNKGGILVLNAQGIITLNADIDVTGKGFKGGIGPLSTQSTYNCYENQYYYPPDPTLSSQKGEGIAPISLVKSFGKGALANGGGSGNSHNSGAAGGGNGGDGGHGGYNYEGNPCNTTVPFDNGGIGGKTLTYNNTINKIFLGGGGGAGQTNSGVFQGNGGNGGGIIIIIANSLQANSNKVIANGNDGTACGNTGPNCHEGMGGGGAGGTILLKINNYLGNTATEVKGGKGGDMRAVGLDRIGPGGGGAGGIVWLTNTSLPANFASTITGGASGVCPDHANDPWGATAGQNGQNIFSLQIPVDNILFKTNIDSVRLKDSAITCNIFDFKGFGYTNTSPVALWQWYFGDGGTATTQNATYSYPAAGSYLVKLVVTDINGCKDSITTPVNPSLLTMDAGPADTICFSNSTTLQSSATGAQTYSWSPPAYVNDPTILNPVASPPVSTTFYLTATTSSGCAQTDSVRIEVRSPAAFSINPPAEICLQKSVSLLASGGDVYAWAPAGSLNNPGIANPVASPTSSTPYSVIITDTICGFSTTLTTTVTVHQLPVVKASKTNDIDCLTTESHLTATGASVYSWQPASSLNDPLIANPIATPGVTTLYSVTGTDVFGCINNDTITVKAANDNNGLYLMPTAFTPNNDGLNDCYSITHWGKILQLEFSIYNRWGQRVFYTTDPNRCWDGTVRGVQQNPGVFVYTITAKTTCVDHVFRKGTFMLIR